MEHFSIFRLRDISEGSERLFIFGGFIPLNHFWESAKCLNSFICPPYIYTKLIKIWIFARFSYIGRMGSVKRRFTEIMRLHSHIFRDEGSA